MINKLLAVTSYVLRFINSVLKHQPRIVGPLFPFELNAAEKLSISSSQKTSYKQEITYLSQRHSACPTLVKQLRLFLDKDKLLRCGGRIHNVPVNESTKFPYFLPLKHNFTALVIQSTHTKSLRLSRIYIRINICLLCSRIIKLTNNYSHVII